MSKELKKFIKKRSYLLWGVSDLNNISDSLIVESVLNYGNFKDFEKLLEIMKIKRVANIFEKQIKMKRSNYRPEIKNYFSLYFKKYLSN